MNFVKLKLKACGLRQICQYPLDDQFDISRKLWLSEVSGHEVMTSLCQVMFGKMGGFCVYRTWVSSIAFWSMFLHCMQHIWCLLISRSHIQLPRGQGHARSRLPWGVSLAHFSHYSFNFIAILSLGARGHSLEQNECQIRHHCQEYTVCRWSTMFFQLIQGHPRSYEVTDIGWDFRAFWNVLAYFGNDLLITANFIRKLSSQAALCECLRLSIDLRP